MFGYDGKAKSDVNPYPTVPFMSDVHIPTKLDPSSVLNLLTHFIFSFPKTPFFIMQLKEALKLVGFSLPHDEEEELMEDWDLPFSPQYTFESFMCGGPKHLRTERTNLR